MAAASGSVKRFTFKVALVGQQGAGKTAFTRRLVKDTFISGHQATTVDFQSVSLELPHGHYVTLQLWDIGGGNTSPGLLSTYLSKCQAVLTMYDVTSTQSFAGTLQWLDACKSAAGGALPYLALIACKSDLEGERAVSLEDHQHLACTLGMYSYCTSSLTGDGVKACAYRIAADLVGVPLSAEHLGSMAGLSGKMPIWGYADFAGIAAGVQCQRLGAESRLGSGGQTYLQTRFAAGYDHGQLGAECGGNTAVPASVGGTQKRPMFRGVSPSGSRCRVSPALTTNGRQGSSDAGPAPPARPFKLPTNPQAASAVPSVSTEDAAVATPRVAHEIANSAAISSPGVMVGQGPSNGSTAVSMQQGGGTHVPSKVAIKEEEQCGTETSEQRERSIICWACCWGR